MARVYTLISVHTTSRIPAGNVWVSGAAVTVKPAVSVPVPVSGLVTTTSRGPAVAAAPIERLAVSCVGETT
ncbi:MAG: hypothetical protein COS65_26260, partial [Armatimonadetes bacterium CG06_land_8_20_14_3_00_66_21]